MNKRLKRPVSGWIVLDKPYGMGSTQAVGKIRWLFSAEKAGHAGTLDPLATGILPIALGEATKTVPYLQGGAKRYSFTLRWGAATSTDDLEGELIATSPVRPTEAEVRAALPGYTGTILQRPPVYSAVKVAGERAYDLARSGQEVTLEARPVTVTDLQLLAHGPEESSFTLACEKGTYVRSLARDLAESLGSCAHVTVLRRTAVGIYSEADAVTLEQLESAVDRDAFLHPLADALQGLPCVVVTSIDRENLLHGRSCPAKTADTAEAWARSDGRAVALGRVENGLFLPSRVFRAGPSD